MMKACVIYLLKGKSAGMKNIHGAKPASVAGSCHSRWRPDAAFIHKELENTISKYFYCGRSYDGSMCRTTMSMYMQTGSWDLCFQFVFCSGLHLFRRVCVIVF